MTDTAVLEPTAVTPETAEVEVQEAEVAQSNDRYPDAAVAQEIARRLTAAHAAGWTRPRISALVARVRRSEVEGGNDLFLLDATRGDGFAMGGSALWRTAKNARVHVEEVPYITCVLDAIDAGDIQLPERPTKDAGKLQERITALNASLSRVVELAEGSSELKGVGPLREVLAEIADTAKG